MKKNTFSRFEFLVQQIIEDKFAGYLKSHLEPEDIASRLLKIIEHNKREGKNQTTFDITLNGEDYEHLAKHYPNLMADLQSLLKKAGPRSGITNFEIPTIQLKISQNVGKRQVVIIPVENVVDFDGHTKPYSLEQVDLDKNSQDVLGAGGFLIIQGKRHINIQKDLLTIGRHADNDIILDSKGVSRFHAQVRWRFGRFVIYDVGDRGLTRVNGVPIREHVLKSGDVITLSNEIIIFGEDSDNDDQPMINSMDDTRTFHPKPS